eukprot:Amastigsp_a2950_48.p2 type:complete len:207 gc:universal Amastigsp_a2950_48:941-321(-)
MARGRVLHVNELGLELALSGLGGLDSPLEVGDLCAHALAVRVSLHELARDTTERGLHLGRGRRVHSLGLVCCPERLCMGCEEVLDLLCVSCALFGYGRVHRGVRVLEELLKLGLFALDRVDEGPQLVGLGGGRPERLGVCALHACDALAVISVLALESINNVPEGDDGLALLAQKGLLCVHLCLENVDPPQERLARLLVRLPKRCC